MINKSYEDLKNEIIGFIKSRYPELNVLHIGDGFADAIIDMLVYIYKIDVDNINLLLRLLFIDDMEFLPDEDIDKYMSNFGLVRKQGVKSSGQVIFYVYNWDSGDKVINSGSVVYGRDSEGLLNYLVKNDYIFLYTDKELYYNYKEGRYEFKVEVEAEDVGSRYNIGAYVIYGFNVSGFDGVYNESSIVGGLDRENNKDFINRLRSALTFNNVGSVEWYKRLIDNEGYEYIDIAIVGNGDDVMVRDGGYGGKIDVYVKMDKDLELVNETILPSDLDSSGYYILKKQPVDKGSIIVNNINGGTNVNVSEIYDENWQLQGGSVKAETKLLITYDSVFTSIDISYQYDKNMEKIQDIFKDERRIVGTDVLIKSGEEVLIDMNFDIKIYNGYNFDDIKTEITNKISDYLYKSGYGFRIEQADLVYIIKQVEGVDNVKIPFNVLAKHGYNDVFDIDLLEYQYANLGDISIGVF